MGSRGQVGKINRSNSGSDTCGKGIFRTRTTFSESGNRVAKNVRRKSGNRARGSFWRGKFNGDPGEHPSNRRQTIVVDSDSKWTDEIVVLARRDSFKFSASFGFIPILRSDFFLERDER